MTSGTPLTPVTPDGDDARRRLPSVREAMESPQLAPLEMLHGRERVLDWVRATLSELRFSNRDDPRDLTREEWTAELARGVLAAARESEAERLRPVINATGVVLHTGLGRSVLPEVARQALFDAGSPLNLELDLATGARRARGYQLEDDFRELTGAEAVLVVNNNAAATLLTLAALGAGREIIISRGQLVEIGGSYRLPDVFEASGALLREIGTTNRTRLSDYEAAITPDTAAILRVHPSNFRVVGFSETPSIDELVPLSRRHELPYIDDIGSGALIDMSALGLGEEPTFRSSLQAGADLVLGSGDKLLGGPQCGIICGRADLIATLAAHPLARAVRVGRLTLTALAAVLDVYRRGDPLRDLPTLRKLAQPESELRARAERLRDALASRLGAQTRWQIDLFSDVAPVGGGSLPGVTLPTTAVTLAHPDHAADEISRVLRLSDPSVLPRIREGRVLLDLRSVDVSEDDRLSTTVGEVLNSRG